METFDGLIFDGGRKKAYLSFPMTHVMELAEVKNQIEGFRERMKQRFICFDPGNLEETYLPWYADKAVGQGSSSVELTVLGKEVRFEVSEIRQIESDIDSQIYARDFKLIDQSDMIISYIPELGDGRAAISSGVERELQHAYEAAKEVYVIWPAEAAPSVFVTQTATKVFKSIDEATEYFSNHG